MRMPSCSGASLQLWERCINSCRKCQSVLLAAVLLYIRQVCGGSGLA